MLAKDLISEVIPPLYFNEKGLMALNLMEVFRISHMPVINSKKELLGIISDNTIYDNDTADELLSSSHIPLGNVFVYADEHIYKVINIISLNKLSSLPVLDRNNKYIGTISLRDLVSNLSDLFSADTPGVVFVLEMAQNNYSLTQIANIIEGNDAKILNLYVKSSKLSTKIEVVIKINVSDFSAIRQALERYDYYIKEAYYKEDKLEEMLNDRYDEFISYLNI